MECQWPTHKQNYSKHFTPFRRACKGQIHLSRMSQRSAEYYSAQRNVVRCRCCCCCCSENRFLPNVCIVSSSGVDMFIASHISLQQKRYTIFSKHKKSIQLQNCHVFFAATATTSTKKNGRRQHDFHPFQWRSIAERNMCVCVRRLSRVSCMKTEWNGCWCILGRRLSFRFNRHFAFIAVIVDTRYLYETCRSTTIQKKEKSIL